jgi:hypothetical protein
MCSTTLPAADHRLASIPNRSCETGRGSIRSLAGALDEAERFMRRKISCCCLRIFFRSRLPLVPIRIHFGM